MNKDIKEHLYYLENKLLTPEVRKSAEEIKRLIADEFIEFCSSGKVYRYSVGDTFYEEGVGFEVTEFELLELSKECLLAKYKLKKSLGEDVINNSIRSSIWKNTDEGWKMIFHQGTIIQY